MKMVVTVLSILFSASAFSFSGDCTTSVKNKITEIDMISDNIANINTTRTPEGGAYRKKVMSCKKSICEIKAVNNEINLKYDPSHYDADVNGYVQYPVINLEDEIQKLITANREYEEIMSVCK